MKKIGSAILLALLLVSGCSAQTPVMNRIQSSGTIRVAIASDQDAVLTDVAQAVSDKMGVTPQYITVDEDTALQLLSEGSADLAVGYYNTADSPGLDYLCTYSFHQEYVYAVCKEETGIILSTRDVKNMLIGASEQLSVRVTSELATISAEETLYCNNAELAGSMLTDGELDVYFCYFDEAEQLMSQGFRCYMPSDIDIQSFCAVTLRRDKQFYSAVNGAVGEYLTEGK